MLITYNNITKIIMKQIKIEIMDQSSQVLDYMKDVRFTVKTGE